MAPEYEKLFDIYDSGKRKDVVIARLEAGSNEFISRRYGISSFPMVLLFSPNKSDVTAVFRGRRVAFEMSAWIEHHAPAITKIVEAPKKHKEVIDENNKLLDAELVKEMEDLKKNILGLEEKIKKLEEEIVEMKHTPKNDTVFIDKTGSGDKTPKEEGKFVVLHEFSMPSGFQTLVGIGAILTVTAIVMTVRKLINQKIKNPDIHHAKV
jgi:hypothetical protein